MAGSINTTQIIHDIRHEPVDVAKKSLAKAGITGPQASRAISIVKSKSDPESARYLESAAKAAKSKGKKIGDSKSGSTIMGKIGDMLGGVAKAGMNEISAQDKQSKAIYRSIGAYDKFGRTAGKVTKQLIEYRFHNAELGVSAEETGDAFENYYNSMNARAIPGQKKHALGIMNQQIQMQRLGVDAKQTTDIFNTWTSAFGMNSDQMAKATGVLAKYAKESGMGKKVFQEYASATQQFMDVLDPNVMHRQSLGFATMATRIGSSANELIGAMKGFDVMDKAQDMGGKLNAVLGPMGLEFDAVKASMMDLPERTKYISDTMKKAGQHAAQFGPRTQRMLLGALNATGVTGAGAGGMKIMRGMMSGRADQQLAAERRMLSGTGAVSGMSSREMRDAAIGGTTMGQKASAFEESNIARLVAKVASPENMAVLSTTIGTGVQNVLMNKADAFADKLATSFHKAIAERFDLGPIAGGFDKVKTAIMKLEDGMAAANHTANKAISQAELKVGGN
tara:strand:+ start:3709 stop:5232 length:1524 start_codon:yes stop_codon:yes gene_type:complete